MVAQNPSQQKGEVTLNMKLDEFIMAWQALRCWGHR